VASTGANASLGLYYAPKVDVTTYSFHSRGVTAGSMRGFGTLQTMTALEVLVDEICTALPLDQIEFRRRNATRSRQPVGGNPYIVSVRTPEILDKLEQHPIWKKRAEQKARGQQAGLLIGTGVACAPKNYGSGGDCSLGFVEITPDGRITIHCDAIEMGTGIGIAVANRVAAHLGRVADEVAVARIDAYGPLALVTSGDSHTISQKTQDAAARNPRWVPAISSPSSASTGACMSTHAAAEAARVILRFGLWPAALQLWGIAPKDRRANQWETARWKDGQLVMPGLPPLALPAIAAKAHARYGVTGAMAHGFNRRPFHSPDRHGPPTSMHWPCAAAPANMLASIVPT
jgi:CO/xanthine dehydrogenase Mo-binding subunit